MGDNDKGKKLSVNKETIRKQGEIDDRELDEAAGGGAIPSVGNAMVPSVGETMHSAGAPRAVASNVCTQ